jgi:hypothetical protein
MTLTVRAPVVSWHSDPCLYQDQEIQVAICPVQRFLQSVPAKPDVTSGPNV